MGLRGRHPGDRHGDQVEARDARLAEACGDRQAETPGDLDVDVKVADENRRILIGRPRAAGPTIVEWTFTSRPDNTTFVSISDTGFKGSDKNIFAQAIGSTEGFALVLAGAKAFLDRGITLELVSDRFPDGLPGH